MRTLYLLLTALLLVVSACATAPAPIAGSEAPTVVERAHAEMRITKIGATRDFGVWVSFRLWGDWTHIVQEITLDNGDVLVECFRGNGWDRHTWPAPPHSRSMVCYPANVLGAHEDDGFAHLPGNGLGVWTTVGPEFNRKHQEDFRTEGYIAERSSYELYWTITDDGDKILVEGDIS